ncbi:WcbI family polysaccharide biosynthesis putative acetyltransferase [Rhodococcus sp. 1168]|uniref:WcbI family polysaccharide biosynthesis putative acetyltransferase n=1 Tax=Rhodococcus sp. 1168 TaxID=2018041 RepID=UPI0020CAFDFE|nr:WcbI family polysaccharide biosynthesis putative acetyltransferase [Rhodococcus sp. 1168]
MTADGRTLHYGSFYGVDSDTSDARPVLLVWGNCQAEALRIVLASSPNSPFRTVRVPPVHELTATDTPHVERLLQQTRILIAQPVRAGYRELPIGTADLTEMAPSITTRLIWPVIRYSGLYPWQIIVRHPSDPSAVPPGVPYHDLRTVLAARDGRVRFEEWDLEVSSAAIVDAAQASVAELDRRERRDCDVAISDVLRPLGSAAAHTVNHPGNAVLIELGRRILDALGPTGPAGPAGPSLLDRELLGVVRAPLERRVIDALGLDAVVRRPWIVDGVVVEEKTIHHQQMSWYAAHPEFVDAALSRYDSLIDLLGLPT